MKELYGFIESLTITQGREAGKKLVLFPWQKRFLRGTFGQDGAAALSCGRGAGKTAFCGAIATAALCGPLVEPGAEVLIVASSFSQGLYCFRYILGFMQERIEQDKERWRIQDSANLATITDRRTGAMLRVLGSDPARLHGSAGKLILADEVAQWPNNLIDRMLSALETSLGKIPNSKMIMLGTRAAAPEHPFEMAFDEVGYAQVHKAEKTDPPFRQSTWRKANPGLPKQPDLLKQIKEEAKRAKHNPAALASFRALRLNLGTPETVESVLLDADTWLALEGEPERRGPYVLGLDLGQSAAMTAAAGFWPATGGLDGFGVFPEYPDLLSRGRADGVDRLYLDCAERGELLTAGARVPDYAALLSEVRRRWGTPACIVSDRYKAQELRQVLDAASFPTMPLILRGQGFLDGAADVREFRRACMDGKVTAPVSLLFRSAIGGARVQTDASANAKLAKGGQGRKSKSRDDAAAAAILAIAEGVRRGNRAAARPEFEFAVI